MQGLTQCTFVGVRVSGANIATGTESTSAVRRVCNVSPLSTALRLSSRSNSSSGSFTHNSLLSLLRPGKDRVTMAKQSAAQGYAQALVQIARSNNVLEAVHADVESLANFVSKPELNSYLVNPVVEDTKKKSILKTLATDAGFNNFTLNFLYLLVDKRRLGALKDICIEFEEQYCGLTDTQVAVVTSAVKLENSQQALVAKKLQGMTGAKNIKLKNVVDPSLIAGFTVKFGKDGSRQIDLSVKGQLDQLAASFEFAENAA